LPEAMRSEEALSKFEIFIPAVIREIYDYPNIA